jgi:hypothetical protein
LPMNNDSGKSNSPLKSKLTNIFIDCLLFHQFDILL